VSTTTPTSSAASSSTAQWQARWDAALMGNYGTPPVVLAHGSGATVWDVDGKEYVDLLGGIAVNLLGHAHPAVVEAVSRQVATLGHTSNLAAHTPGIELAERLCELAGAGPGSRVLFTNSGAEANEAALKLSRRLRPAGGWVACEGAFHGRTMGALAVTGQAAKRAPFEPLPGPVAFVP
jgi:acetylornithine/N-succinyldiaminopimelate aminotransferase